MLTVFKTLTTHCEGLLCFSVATLAMCRDVSDHSMGSGGKTVTATSGTNLSLFRPPTLPVEKGEIECKCCSFLFCFVFLKSSYYNST